MHEKILQEIEKIKSNKELSPQERLDSLFEVKSSFAKSSYVSWITSESRNIMFFMVTFIFFLVTYENQDIKLFIIFEYLFFLNYKEHWLICMFDITENL